MKSPASEDTVHSKDVISNSEALSEDYRGLVVKHMPPETPMPGKRQYYDQPFQTSQDARKLPLNEPPDIENEADPPPLLAESDEDSGENQRSSQTRTSGRLSKKKLKTPWKCTGAGRQAFQQIKNLSNADLLTAANKPPEVLQLATPKDIVKFFGSIRISRKSDFKEVREWKLRAEAYCARYQAEFEDSWHLTVDEDVYAIMYNINFVSLMDTRYVSITEDNPMFIPGIHQGLVAYRVTNLDQLNMFEARNGPVAELLQKFNMEQDGRLSDIPINYFMHLLRLYRYPKDSVEFGKQ